MTEPTCKTCRWLGIPAGERVSRNRVYPCLAPLPDLTKILPLSVTGRAFWKPTSAGYMHPDEGAGCPCHKPKEKKDE